MRRAIIVYEVCLLVLSTCFIDIHSEATCEFTVEKVHMPPLFSRDSIQLKTIGRHIKVLSPGICILNSEDIFRHFQFSNSTTIVAYFLFGCVKNTSIRFNNTGHEDSILENVIGYFQATKCLIDASDGGLYTFLKLTNNRVFTLRHSNFSTTSGSSNIPLSCNTGLFEETVSLVISNVPTNINYLIDRMFPCKNSVKEIIITDCKGIVNQTLLEHIFSNLQTIEIKDCTLSGVLNFPWKPLAANLPDNLSRSDYLQEHYSRALHLNIPSHNFRRQFSLINTTSNESNIFLNGSLDYFQLSRNPISTIDEKLFRHTRSIQVVILSKNKIREINENAFDSLIELTLLDMSRNELSFLYPGTFSKLKNLAILDLSHNKLYKLAGKLLFFLNNLVELNLDHNEIISMSEDVLPTDNIKFQRLTVNFNPLKAFPVAVFYIRSIKLVEFRHTRINFRNMSKILEQVDKNKLESSVIPSRSSLSEDILETTDEWRVIDLTGSDVTGFILDGNITSCIRDILVIILKHFKFVLKNNPLSCFVEIIPFNKLLVYYTSKGYFTGDEYFYREWLCKYPTEFENKHMLKISEKETYGIIHDKNCPSTCSCYKRAVIDVNIVDGRRTGALSLPDNVPNGYLDIWMSHNNISEISVKAYFKRIRQLDLSNNTISFIPRNVFFALKRLHVLKLDNNLLTKIPENIKLRELVLITLKNNPFVCDCKMLWFKHWTRRQHNFKNDFDYIDCFTEGKELSFRLFTLPDRQFTCKHPPEYDDNTLKIAGTGIAVFIVLFVILIIFICKKNIKLFMFTNLHWHPFDRGRSEAHEYIDLTIIHEVDSSEFVKQRLIVPLKSRFTVMSVYSDFIAGYSFQENIRSAIYHSKHILLVISDKMVANKQLLEYTWRECQNKIKMTRMNFLLVTRTEGCGTISPLSRDVRRYLKHHPQLNPKRSVFQNELRYILSSFSTVSWTVSLTVEETGNAQIFDDIRRQGQLLLHPINDAMDRRHDIFCCYGNGDRIFSQDILIPYLEQFGYNIITPDGDFNPGECILNNIGEAVENSVHTLFITSSLSSLDDIQALVFQKALEKTRLFSYNHLVVIVHNDAVTATDNKEISDYLYSFVFLDARDNNFFSRLKMALYKKQHR